MVKDKEQETARRSNHKVEQLRALLARAQAYSHFLAGRLGGPVALGCGSAIDESPSVAVSPRVCGQREGGRGRRRRRGGMPSDDDDGGCRASLEKEQAGREDARTDFMQPRTVVGGTLRGYQLEGVQWLVSLFENGLNGILADEMGLGKTVQCIAFVAFLREQGVLGPFLIVAPLSTLANWMSEFERFAPTIPILMYHGSQSAREEMRSKCHLAKPNAQSFSVLVTSYEIAMRDARHLGSITWKYMIIDEGHRLKNLNCRLIRELKAYKSDNRLLLTGTPLQNNLTELWSLLNFLLPEIFTDVDDFLSWFDLDLEAEGLGEHERADDDSDSNMTGMAASMVEDERAEMISKLHSILKPLLLRRLKSDVESDLPRKKEYVLSASLSPLQREYYQIVLQGRAHQLVQRNERRGREGEEATPLSDKRRRTGRRRRKSHVIPDKDDADSVDEEMSSNEDPPTIEPARAFYSSAQGLQNRIMQLRKVCNHPYLFLHPTHPDDPTRLLVDEQLVQCSGKMRLLDQLLDALRQEDHKVLIFSQMSRMLDILGNFLDLRDIQYCRIDGSVAQTERQQELHRFNTQPSVGVFLLSTRAGGLGLNLVAADTVIFYDSDWVRCRT